MSRLYILTIVLDGMPFLPAQLINLNRIDTGLCDWKWLIAEGQAANVLDTSWCRPQPGRLSRDGTTEFLDSLRGHPRITVQQKQLWQGKLEMVNACVSTIKEPCVLLQMDVDEFWTVEQLVALPQLIRQDTGRADFACRYFVAPNIIVTNGDPNNVWTRAWSFMPGMKFMSHEPPRLASNLPAVLTVEATRKFGLVFDHYAYFTDAQVAYKEAFYGYRGAGEHWHRLQRNRDWPTPLKRWLPWSSANSQVDLLHK